MGRRISERMKTLATEPGARITEIGNTKIKIEADDPVRIAEGVAAILRIPYKIDYRSTRLIVMEAV